MKPSPVNLVVALPAEAKPIVAWLGLHRRPQKGFALYQREQISLVVSGPGKVAAAAATGWLFAQTGCVETAIWLNLGIAGHRNRPLGQAVLAARILDAGSGKSWDLPSCSNPPAELETLVTLDRPGTHYHQGGAVEMEAAGFYATARHFSPLDRIHCLKVISDNADNPATEINGRRVRQWVTAHMGTLERLLQRLED